MPNISQLNLTPLFEEWLNHAPTKRIAEGLKAAMGCYNRILRGRR